MRPLARACLLPVLFLTGLSEAHDFWIEPSSFRPAAPGQISATLLVGQNLQGEPLPRIPPLVERFFLRGAGNPVPFDGESGADPAGIATVERDGLYWIEYQSKPYPVTLDAAKFEAYLKEEGLERIIAERSRRGESAAPGRERFHRCAKSLLAAGTDKASQTGTASDPLGLTLELVPQRNPYSLAAGAELPFSLLFRGRPVSDILVVAMNRAAPQQQLRARTDSQGRVTLRLGRPGLWLVKAVHMEAALESAGAFWESWWASVTFELPDRRPK